MASDKPVTDDGGSAERPTREERVAAARAVVYDDEGELIDAADLEDALVDAGVDAGVSDDGLTEYRNVPRELPLGACHLAVDLRRDPATLIGD